MSRCFAKVLEVTASKISCEIITEQLPFNFQGDTYNLNSVGSLVSLYDSFNHYTMIYQVIKIYEKEQVYNSVDYSKFKKSIVFEAIPLAEMTRERVDFGVNIFPMVGDQVFLSSLEEKEKTYSGSNEGISIGSIPAMEVLTPTINDEMFFSSHVSIFGNTNSGKSTTVKRIIKETLKKDENFNSIIFDVHDEYEIENTSKIHIEDISIDPAYIDIEDWINLINPSSLVQLPILINGIKYAQHLGGDVLEDLAAFISYSAFNSNIETSSTKLVFVKNYSRIVNNEKVNKALQDFELKYGNFDKSDLLMNGLAERFYEITGLDINQGEEYIVNKYLGESNPTISIDNLKEGIDIALTIEESRGNLQVRSHCQTMMTRIDLLLSHFKAYFVNDKKKREHFDKIFDDKKTKILKVSHLPDDTLRFITHLILRVAFKKQKQSESIDRINFIFDEAHKYIKKNKIGEDIVTDIFETIAREGRKFGVYLCICSQQPHELSSTVISQCGNFIMHRMKNSLDLDFIRKSNPYITELQISRLSSLPTGTALVLGDSIPIPLELAVKE
ncbi:ATP-binding protein [Aquibacillus sediminis]|uniref:ATP-binding protein n=1 Tax=Aquibacillus sediminis TaxID=2574734 RepID=UPI0011084F5A|nr:ATP-binding protein [Aquibacillus sediminis]